MDPSDSATPCPESADDDLEWLYGAVLSDLEGLLDPKYGWKDNEASRVGDMIVQYRTWGVELDIKSGTLRWLPRDYPKEAAGIRVNLQAVQSSLTRLISSVSRDLEVKVGAEMETDKTTNTELEDTRLTFLDSFTRCIDGLRNLSESLLIIIRLHTQQGTVARVKELMNAKKLPSASAQLPKFKTAQKGEDAEGVELPEKPAISARDQPMPKYPPLSVVMNNTPGPMAHLASFGGSTAIKVPYVCQQMFQGSIFDYPERRGWDKDKLYRGDLEGKPLEDLRGFLQEWLYFGPLFHILDIPGMSFNPRDFVYRDEKGEEWITTEKLPDYMKRWYFRPGFGWRGGRTLEQREETFRHVYTGLIEIHRYVLRYCGRDSNSGDYHPTTSFWPLTPELSLSIIVLADSLTKAGFEATGKSFNLNWGNSSLLVDRMIASGWCPNVVSTLTTTQQVHIFYSAQTLGAPYLVRNHADCSELVCKIDQVDGKTYKTEHTTDGCQCSFRGPEIDEVVEILRTGGIPLIEFHESDGSFNVRVVRVIIGTPSRDYIAISHVWSDGLGNPSQNSLPICQLRRLQQFVNNIDRPSPSMPRAWWCDTLCVPVQKNLIQWRKVAIRRMKETYMNANKVLVLDKGLLCVSSSASPLEIYLRLKLSNWMRRLWTFQEGTVGNTIAIQFLDSTRDFSYIDKSMTQEEQNLSRFIYTRYSFDSHTLFGTFLRQGEKPQHLNLEAYSKLLQWRSTSKQADETVCLMSMLGMTEPLKELLELKDSDYTGRMILFFRSLTAIPITVLYQPPAPIIDHRLSVDTDFLSFLLSKNSDKSLSSDERSGIYRAKWIGILVQKCGPKAARIRRFSPAWPEISCQIPTRELRFFPRGYGCLPGCNN